MAPALAKLLDEKLADLEKQRAWSPRLISKLEALLNDPDEFALHRVNPIKFATDKGIEEQEAIDLFLNATKLGIFKMEWHLICPSCGDAMESFGALNGVHTHYECRMCHIDGEAQFDDYIETAFSVSPQVRECGFHRPEKLSVQDFYFRYHFNNGAITAYGISMTEMLKSSNLALSYLEAGESREFEIEVKHGFVFAYDLIVDSGWLWTIKDGPSVGGQNAKIQLDENGYKNPAQEFYPGKIKFSVENRLATRASIMVGQMPPNHFELKKPVVLPRFLTGNRLLNSQTFRSLFRGETIQGSEGIGIRDLTLLFTDLKGSTEMYERIGDLKAFNLVQQHFDHLGKAIQLNRGAIVKTIGDAVMASFDKAADAVAAAALMLKEIEAFNKSQGADEIILKIGIHKGPSIAVTLNNSLDFFGQTVNVAARVQGLAGAEEIFVTREIFDAPGVAELLKGFHIQAQEASIKGLQKKLPVYRISERPFAKENSLTAQPAKAKAPKARAVKTKSKNAKPFKKQKPKK